MLFIIFIAVIIIGFMYEDSNDTKRYYEEELKKYKRK